MPSLTGTLDDNAIELLVALLGNLADLPFNGFFVDEAEITLPALVISHPGAFEIRGSGWPAVSGRGWRPVSGRAWAVVPGMAWRDIRRPR